MQPQAPSFTSFQGDVPINYDRYLGPFLFEPYAIDLVARMNDKAARRVLELACGTGRVTRHLVERIAGRSTLTASDLNADMLTMAQHKLQGSDVQWQVADVQALPFPGDVFTAVVCQFGIMFVPDKLTAFKEAHRVLQTGGLFLFNTWDAIAYNPANAVVQDVLQEVLGTEAPQFLKQGPFSFYDTEHIKQLLLQAGFKEVYFETVAKTGTCESATDVVNGFLKGTPLAVFLSEKNAQVVQEITTRLTKALTDAYGAQQLQIPMQAIVCHALK